MASTVPDNIIDLAAWLNDTNHHPANLDIVPNDIAALPTDTNPFLRLKQIVCALWDLGSDSPDFIAFLGLHHRLVTEWKRVEPEARAVAVASGIPIEDFGPVLSLAEELLIRSSAGGAGLALDGGIPAFKGDCLQVMRRLEDLAARIPESVLNPARQDPPAVTNTMAAPENDNLLAVLRLFTGGVSDERFHEISRTISDDKLTVCAKLTKVAVMLRIPPGASAKQLSELLGCSKQAVFKTEWWTKNRRGEKENIINRRQQAHQARAKTYEAPSRERDDD